MQRRLFLFLLPSVLLAQNQSQFPEAKLRRIEQVVGTEMARHSMPGVSIAVASDGVVRWAGGFGLADIENMVPVTASTRIRLGSISKPITAVAVLQLVERGKIDLDAEIQKYVPSFPRKQWPVTVRQLLGHQSGIRHYRDGEIESVAHYADVAAPFRVFQNDALLFEPGTRYSYTTYGFNVLGAAVEGASGMKFMDYLRENIFKPAGMDRISDDNTFEIIPNRARGYQLRGGRLLNCGLADTSNKIPGGGMISTSSDLARFALAVISGKLVKKETAQLMFTPQKLRDGSATTYGMGFTVQRMGERERIGHSGGQQGITTDLAFFRDGMAVAIMTNLEANRGTRALSDGIARVVLE